MSKCCVLLYFLAIVSKTSKDIDLKFSAYSELVGVSSCASKTLYQEVSKQCQRISAFFKQTRLMILVTVSV